MTRAPLSERELLDAGLAVLRDLLGQGWRITLREEQHGPPGRDRMDAVVEVEASGIFTQLLVEVKGRLLPKDVESVLLPMVDVMRRVGSGSQLLVISPWLSPRTQKLLRASGIGYLDLTGNVWLRVSRPAIVIHTQGESRAPRSAAAPRTKPQLSGLKAGRLVRLLTDVAPPYRAGELAKASRLSLPYVSRLLDALDEQLLIRRDGRVITHVDWPNLLRLRAEQLYLLKHNPYAGAIAPAGLQSVVTQLHHQERIAEHSVAATGSYAARAVAPLAVGGQLMIYVPPTLHASDQVIGELGLLRAEEGAEVLLLRAHDDVVFQRTRVVDGMRCVALSQLVLDCLSGPGRMPAEGEAVLQYMADNEKDWRAASNAGSSPNMLSATSSPSEAPLF